MDITLDANINGKAGSIEMYLSVDVLNNDKDNFYPIYLSSYDAKIKQYQGALCPKDKELVQKKFRTKIRNFKNSTEIKSCDWDGMQKIINMIKHIWD